MNLKPISSTTTLTNALPKMYDNWQEFYHYWRPWVHSTGQKYLTFTQLENGVINLYNIDWTFVVIECHRERNFNPFGGLTRKKVLICQWLYKLWTGKVLNRR